MPAGLPRAHRRAARGRRPARVGRSRARPARRRGDRQRRSHRRPHLRGLSPASRLLARRRVGVRAGPLRPGGSGGGIPAGRVGRGRRSRRGSFMYGEDIDLAFRLRRPGGGRYWRRMRSRSTSARPASTIARPGSATTAGSARGTSSAATAYSAAWQPSARSQRRPSSSRATRCSRATWRRRAAGSPAGGRRHGSRVPHRPPMRSIRDLLRRQPPAAAEDLRDVNSDEQTTEERWPACGGELEPDASLRGNDRLHGNPGAVTVRCCRKCGSGVSFPLASAAELPRVLPVRVRPVRRRARSGYRGNLRGYGGTRVVGRSRRLRCARSEGFPAALSTSGAGRRVWLAFWSSEGGV